MQGLIQSTGVPELSATGQARPVGFDIAQSSPTCLVVMYHYVHGSAPEAADDRGGVVGRIPGLNADEFRAQLVRLKEQLEPVDWPRFFAWTRGERALPALCFLLTFDDGLKGHVKTVVPILQEEGLRGTFFVPGIVLSGATLLSAHAVHLLLANVDEQTFHEALCHHVINAGGSDDLFSSVNNGMAQRLYAYETPARARLKYLLTMVLPVELRSQAVDALFRRFIGPTEQWARSWYLDANDLAMLQSCGHTIGGHGFLHEPYTRLTARQRRDDMERVADVLNAKLGRAPRPFSYPFGQFDDPTAVACRDAGFVQAFTTQRRWVTARSDRFGLPRVDTIHVNTVLTKAATCPLS